MKKRLFLVLLTSFAFSPSVLAAVSPFAPGAKPVGVKLGQDYSNCPFRQGAPVSAVADLRKLASADEAPAQQPVNNNLPGQVPVGGADNVSEPAGK